MRNVFSIDLEDWFCSHNLAEACPYSTWHNQQSRVAQSTRKLLDLMDEYGVSGTFFVLGWVADQFPDLVAEVASRGHEIASHGYAHQRVTTLQEQEFDEDIRRANDAIYRATGVVPSGYRAPAFSVVHQTMWATDVLKKNGFLYDSSIYPISGHPDYGIGDFPLDAHTLPNGLFEIPMSVAEYGPLRLPCSGGGYLRQFPFVLFKSLVTRCHTAGRPLVFYIHPWELDPDTPRVALSALKKWRHYNNLHTTESKLRALLNTFEFATMQEVFNLSKEQRHENRT